MSTSQTLYVINKRPKDDMSDEEHQSNICEVCDRVKDETKIKWLLESIEVNDLFRDLNKTQKRHIVLAMKLIETKQNTIVLKQHSVIPQTVYVVEDGEFFAIIDGMRVRSWVRKGIFGELALLYDSPRAATIECVSDIGHLWELDRTTFQNIVNQYEIEPQESEDDDQVTELSNLMVSGMIRVKKRSSMTLVKEQIQLCSRALAQKRGNEDYKQEDEMKTLFKDKPKQDTNDAIAKSDALNCIEFKRIAHILSKYQNNDIGNSAYQYLNNVLGENYSYSQLCDDFYYVVNTHQSDYDFEVLYNILLCQYLNNEQCIMDRCLMFSRNRRDRSQYDDNMKKYYNENMNTKDIMTIQLLDKIHCYFLHSYHQNHRVRNDELSHKSDDNDVSEMTSLIRGRRSRTRMHHNKYNMATMDKYKEEQDEEQKQKQDGDLVYSFGVEYWYWDPIDDTKQNQNDKRLMIPHKYTSLKEELLCNDVNTLNKHQWDILLATAEDMMQMDHVKQIYIADYNNRGIKRGEIITALHLISLMVYCNYDVLQREFTETYRKVDANETNQSLIKRHSNFHNLGKTLYESVNIYGKSIKDYKYKKFYHGISNEMMFASPKARIYGPLSTTICLTVAVHFSDEEGLVVTLQGDEWEDNKYFDMSWISEYASESECFFIGGLLPLRFKGILNTKTAVNYRKYFPKFGILFNKIFNGVKYTFNGSKGGKEKKIIEILMNARLKVLNVDNDNDHKKDYIFRLFDYYCSERAYVSINYPYFQKEFDVFFDVADMLNLDDLLNVFPKLQRLKIDYVDLSSVFMERILHLITNKSQMNKTLCVLEKVQLNWPNAAQDIETVIGEFVGRFAAINFKIDYRKQENKLFIHKK